jgi:hypothetical protein
MKIFLILLPILLSSCGYSNLKELLTVSHQICDENYGGIDNIIYKPEVDGWTLHCKKLKGAFTFYY